MPFQKENPRRIRRRILESSFGILISPIVPNHISSLHNFFYFVTYFAGFLQNFTVISLLVTLYVNYLFIFQPEVVENLTMESLRWRSMAWKIFLTIIAIFLNLIAPSPFSDPVMFQFLTNGQKYDR